jgi:hypothetical protein
VRRRRPHRDLPQVGQAVLHDGHAPAGERVAP